MAHVLYSFDTGGLEKGIATLVQSGSPAFEHTIVCLTKSGSSERLLPPGTRVLQLHKPPGNSPAFLVRLGRLLKNLRPDVVHTRNWSGMDGIVASRLAGIRNIVHGEHGWGMEDPSGQSAKRLLLRRLMLHWCRECTCVSKAMESWLREKVRVQRPVTQIYNGIDTNRFRPGDGTTFRSELKIEENAFIVGTVGRLDPIKDHKTLIAAFYEFREKMPDAVLVIAGDGPERTNLEALAGDGVRLIGNRLDVDRILRACNLFVLSSLNEGISNTILEAMATGVPIVATGVGGNPELIENGHTGTLVPPGDKGAMAEAMLVYALNRTLAAGHGMEARKCAEINFSIDRMVSSYQAVWERVILGSNRSVG